MTRTVIMFPGQGAQKVGMGRENFENHPVAREIFQQADEILGFDLSRICFEGPEEELERTDVSQPAILVSSVASLEAYRAAGGDFGDPGVTLGLSLGEYTALWYAGVLSFEDAVRLVRLRGQCMQEACEKISSGMLSVIGLDRVALEAVAQKAAEGEVLQLANFLAPKQIVLSGAAGALERASVLAQEAGARKTVPLAVAGAFHSELMRSAQERLAAEVDRIEMNVPRIPVMVNVDAVLLSDVAEIRSALVRQLTGAVYWVDSMRQLVAQGGSSFYEVGPGRVLSGLLKRVDRKVTSISIDNVDSGT
ncbi:MAG: ACP S-malonyltransferase [Planctomycetota bacterium]|nr:ACP S-malonyltransferase [Planctomycetota bacterium]